MVASAQQLTWSEALEEYWLARRREFSRHTALDYGLIFKRFGAFVGERPLAAIGSGDVHRFLNAMEDEYGLARKTLSNYWTALSSFWTWAEPALDVPHVIRGRVPRPRYRRKSIRPYTVEEARLLLEACQTMQPWVSPRGRVVEAARPSAVRDRAMIMCLLDTGLRASELCALQMRDYDRRQRELRVRHGKGDKEREVYLGESAGAALETYLAERRMTPQAWLFVTRRGGPLDRNQVRHLVIRLADKAQVAGANVHRFRHTFAVSFLRNGGNVFALQRLLGHESMATIRIYVQLAQDDLRAAQLAASPADRWFGEPSSHP